MIDDFQLIPADVKGTSLIDGAVHPDGYLHLAPVGPQAVIVAAVRPEHIDPNRIGIAIYSRGGRAVIHPDEHGAVAGRLEVIDVIVRPLPGDPYTGMAVCVHLIVDPFDGKPPGDAVDFLDLDIFLRDLIRPRPAFGAPIEMRDQLIDRWPEAQGVAVVPPFHSDLEQVEIDVARGRDLTAVAVSDISIGLENGGVLALMIAGHHLGRIIFVVLPFPGHGKVTII